MFPAPDIPLRLLGTQAGRFCIHLCRKSLEDTARPQLKWGPLLAEHPASSIQGPGCPEASLSSPQRADHWVYVPAWQPMWQDGLEFWLPCPNATLRGMRARGRSQYLRSTSPPPEEVSGSPLPSTASRWAYSVLLGLCQGHYADSAEWPVALHS